MVAGNLSTCSSHDGPWVELPQLGQRWEPASPYLQVGGLATVAWVQREAFPMEMLLLDFKPHSLPANACIATSVLGPMATVA